MNRKRRKHFRPNPKTKEDAFKELKDQIQSEDGDHELIRVVKDGIVLIARKHDLSYLNSSNLRVFADGTFKYAPRHFKQMYTFFIYKDGFYLPIAHFLLQNKFFKTYKKSLKILREQCQLLGFDLDQNFNNGSIMLDFECAMMKAVKSEFKNCTILGCRFHLGQNWWRKIKEIGLSKEYKTTSSRIGQWLRGVFGLSLLPQHLVEDTFNSYIKVLRNPCCKINKFIKYLSEFYIKPSSIFNSSMWAGLSFKVTNNGAEAFHRHFGDLFGYLKSKPSIWHFLRNMSRFNVIKTVKMHSFKPTQGESEQDNGSLISSFTQKKISVSNFLRKLSRKNQPKTLSGNKRKRRKRI